MLRGVSLAPHQRLVKDPQELPSELVNSIIGVSARTLPDYGATGSRGGAALLSTSDPQADGTGGSPSFLKRVFRSAQRRYHAAVPNQVPIFDVNGSLTTSQTGVNTFRFRSLSLFYFFRAQSWAVLITYSILLYLIIVLFIAATYYAWGLYCGAGVNVVASIYFTVVSLAANGGYLGEDGETMVDSTNLCYRGRTAIVMVCSYVNIVFVGLVAALVVGKAEYTGKLGHRVVFSDFCTLTSIPGRVGQYRLTFRMANVDNNIPLAQGKLRLFCVTAEPLREYRMRQKQMYVLKNSAPPKTAWKPSHGSVQQLLPGVDASNSLRALGGGGVRGRRVHRRAAPAAGENTGKGKGKKKGKNKGIKAEEEGQRSKGTSPHLPSASASSSVSRASTPSRSSASSSRSTSAASTPAPASELQTAGKTKTRHPTAGVTRTPPATAAATGAASDSTNSSMTSRQNSGLYGASPVGGMGGSFPDPSGNARVFSAESVAAAAAVQGAGAVQVPDRDDDDEMERVHLRVREIRWTCAEETYLDRGDSGQLSLWYPATIIHTIDERSPLHNFMNLPFVAASLKEGPSSVLGSACSDDRGVHPPSLGTGSSTDTYAAHHRFQLVAVFDATEMESGSTITAKHTYTTVDIVAQYKFSDRLVHMHPGSGEVMLDFHYFNALLPMDLVELSTTDSER
ncbi:hypothetical protein ABL78_4547 [Leptomonas seymouri]|uniref:Uncharacterized protein n=1 Tax=Leptomonas seymouri TaxID=5684 RepID=A0A0N0P5F2_LEPSE|nr:hypothetical protein ABL78_4547 [Leptomonas seymouri]|eukprot:KPI86396.1 hypothetical protein ABL78_4547 [Leptomonas seymouri]